MSLIFRCCYYYLFFVVALLLVVVQQQQSKAAVTSAFVVDVVHPSLTRTPQQRTEPPSTTQQLQRVRLHLSPSNGIRTSNGRGSEDDVHVPLASSLSSSSPSFQPQMGAVGGRYFGFDDDDDNESDNKELELVEREYRRKLVLAQEAMADVEAARQRVTEKMKNRLLLLETPEEASLIKNKRRRQRLPSPPEAVGSTRTTKTTKIEYSDAGTLSLTIPAQGMSTNSVFAGAFSAAWFSAIVPATLATGGIAGALFMVPFWAAGGMVAKNAVFDPFVTTKLSIGQYAYSLEKVYAGKTVQKIEGSTDHLTCAAVDVAIVVNDTPQYALKLSLLDNNNTSSYSKSGGTTTIEFGLGLSVGELQSLANEINDCLLERINVVDRENFKPLLQQKLIKIQ